MDRNQTEGRKHNAAQPLGEREGLVDKEQTRKTGLKERQTAGPDGPDATDAAKIVGTSMPD